VVAYHEFDPYGVPMQDGGDPYGFTGEWWEDEVDLLHLRARWYDPELGRFISKDVWPGNYRQPLSMNPYLYSLANPANFFDTSGYFATNECDPPFDGYMEGVSLTYSNFADWVDQVGFGRRPHGEVFFAKTVAIEWVYDFEHTQWAVFLGASQTFETSFGLSASTMHYQGTIDGFWKNADVEDYGGPFYILGLNGQFSIYLFGFGTVGSLAHPIDGNQWIGNMQQARTATILYDKMTVAYRGYYASIGLSVGLTELRGLKELSTTILGIPMSASGGVSIGSSKSVSIHGPFDLNHNSEELARLIEEGLDAECNLEDCGPDYRLLGGKRLTAFNPLLSPLRKNAFSVLRYYRWPQHPTNELTPQ
jgi:RHS repeat-associated protein